MLSEQARMKMYASQKRIHKETLDHIHVTCKKGNKKGIKNMQLLRA